ncbi:SRPBCC family protein [Dongia sp. agr-C8]
MNDSRSLTIAPVRKSLLVRAPQVHAFEVFTAGLDRWWPKSHHIGPAEPKQVMIEPRVGGRWFERTADGTETAVGHVLVWEPPQRFAVSWEINGEWQSDPGLGSEVEIRFIAEGPDATRVELEHRLFERMGAEGGTKMHDSVDRGWPAILALFEQLASKP